MKWYKTFLVLVSLTLCPACGSQDKEIRLGALDHFKRGNKRMEQLQYKAALSEYQISLNYDFKQPVVHYNIGLAYYSLMLFGEAIVAYEKAIKLQPGFAEAWYNLSLALYRLGKTEDAYTANEKYISLSKTMRSGSSQNKIEGKVK